MGAVVVVAVGERVDQGVELPAALGQGVDGMELVAPGGLHAFDAPVELGAVELGAAGREDIEGAGLLTPARCVSHLSEPAQGGLPERGHFRPRCLRVVAAERGKLASKTRPVQDAEERLHGRQIEQVAGNRQVVTLGDERNKAQTKDIRRDPRRDAAVRLPLLDRPSGGQVPRRDIAVPANGRRFHARLLQAGIEKGAAARPAFAVDDARAVAGKVGRRA